MSDDEFANITDITCMCGHLKNYHYVHLHTCSVSMCRCSYFISALEVERNKDRLAKLKQVREERDDRLKHFASMNRCPKCRNSVSPNIEYHPARSWYQRSCSLGIKTEHMHIICDMCGADYSVKAMDRIMKDIRKES